MAAIQFPTINGVRHDHSSVEIVIDGVLFNGVKDVSWKHSLEPGEVKGNSANVTGRTRGSYKAEGEITLYEAESSALIAALDAKGLALGMGFMEVPFDVLVTRAENFMPPITSKLSACRITSTDHSSSEGGDALVVKHSLHVMLVQEGIGPSGLPVKKGLIR